MKPRADPAAGAAQAIERVLRAEQQAALELAAARERARADVESAREQGRAAVNRAAERIALWRKTHAERLALRVQSLRDEAERRDRSHPAIDPARAATMADEVAATLAGGQAPR